MSQDFSKFNIVVVGAGFFGATIAQKCSNSGIKTLVLDRRPHIAGNAYTENDAKTGIEVHKYGAHLFHTPNRMVWDYINSFGEFSSYQHKVYTNYKGQIYPMPINLGTICQFFGRSFTPDEARALVREHAGEITSIPRNLEEKAISLIGRPLFEAFVQGYTKKQWQTDLRELPENIITRLPVRYNFNNRYFNDPFEGLPKDGYTKIVENMLAHHDIHVSLNTDFFQIQHLLNSDALIIFTGPIDRYFEYKAGELKWRTIDFTTDVVPVNDFQGTPVMNYADENVPYTRIIEFKHFQPDRNYPEGKTLIMHEYSRFATSADEPYYPVNTAHDKKIYLTYSAMAANETNVLFGGRLGTYRYLDMHQAIGAALRMFETEIVPRFNLPNA